ncbi:MAG: hypothetical protein U0T82_04115 [Bacteroidales bacterium]
MTSKLKIFCLTLQLIAGGSLLQAQDNPNCREIIRKIDSIAVSRNITEANVFFNTIGNVFDRPSGGFTIVTRRDQFSFDGPFLVMGGTYFNMEKLVYFKIRDNSFDLYLQGW